MRHISHIRPILKKIKLRTWVALGIIIILLPVALFSFFYWDSILAALGGSNATPAAHWAFDEGTDNTCSGGSNDACDTSGNSNDGAFGASTAAPAWQTEDKCVSGNCLLFDGSNDTVTVANTVSSIQTVSFFVKVLSTLTTEQILDLNGTDTFSSVNGTVTVAGFGTDTIYVDGKAGATTLTANRWHHVAVTTTSGFSGSAITMGNISTNFGNIFLDELKLFTTELSADQVRAEFAGGAAVFGAADTAFLNEGLFGYWKMDQTSGDAIDSSGGSKTLTNVGTTPFNTGKFGNAPTFNGSSRYFTYLLSFSGVQTISFWAKPASTTDNYINFSSGVYISSSSGTISATGFTNPTIYVNGVQSTTISASVWQLVTVTTTTALGTADVFDIGRANGTVAANNSQIDEVRIYDRVLSPGEVKSLYSWAPGPVGYWKLDENTGTSAYDSSGNSFNGTLTNSPTYKTGKFGSGLDFGASTNQHVIYDDTGVSALDIPGSYSLEAWVKFNALTAENQIIAMKSGDNGTNINYFMQTGYTSGSTLDEIECGHWNGTGDSLLTTNLNLVTNTWYHLACVHDAAADTITLFVNGSQFAQTTGETQTPPTGNGDMYLGNYFAAGWGPPDSLNGTLDEVRVYNYPRTSQQVVEDMNAGHPAGGSPIGSQALWWKFDEQAGPTAFDQSTNALNGTLTNGPLWRTASNCKFNGCILFDGTNDHVTRTISSATTALSTLTSGTVSLWANLNDTDVNNVIFSISRNANTTQTAVVIEINTSSNTITSTLHADNTTQWSFDVASSVFNPSTEAGNWHHFVLVHNGTTPSFFIDGREVAITFTTETDKTDWFKSILTDATSPSDRVTAGAVLSNNTVFSPTNGYIDDIQIFSSALTADQIKIVKNANASLNFGTGTIEDGAGNPPSAWYTFDESVDNTCTGGTNDVCDRSGNTNDGAFGATTAAPTWTIGKIGSAARFDGSNDFVNFGDLTFTESASALTWSFWIRPTTLAVSTVLMGKVNVAPTGQHGWSFGTDSATATTLAVNIPTSASDFGTFGQVTSALANNTWRHVTVVFDGSLTGNSNRLKIYLDGVPQTVSFTGTIPASTPATTSNARAGSTSDGLLFSAMTLDELKIYNYARTPAQVAHDFNRSGPVAWYKMDDNVSGSSQTINDLSTRADMGNALDGTTSGGASMDCTGEGKINLGCDFDGTDDVVTVANATPIDLNEGLLHGLTFAAWINPDTAGEGTGGEIFRKTSTTFCRLTGSSPFNISCSLDLATDATLTVNSVIPANTWTHVAMSWANDGDDEITIWINGKTMGTSTDGVGDPSTDTASLLIGGGTSNNFDGTIDDFRIYNYEPTAAQIRMVALNQSGAFFAPETGSP